MGLMDRVISLLAALVGLIALGGAILVHVHGDAQRNELAAQIAGLKASIASPTLAPRAATPEALATAALASSSSSLAPSGVETSPLPLPTTASSGTPDTAAQLEALENRIAELERINGEQASELARASAQIAAASTASTAPPSAISVAEASAPAPLSPPSLATASALSPASSAPAAAAAASGATADCIPVGTRFMGKTGDSFPICKTTAVVKVAAVNDGNAIIEGAGPIAAGSFADLATKGCTVMVFSADTTGYAEMRVTCQ
jgi:hypothetical protein